MPHELEHHEEERVAPEVEHAEEVTVIHEYEEAPERGWPFGYPLLWLLVVISLLLNAFMLRQVVLARSAARQAVDDAQLVVEGLKTQSFSYDFVIDDTLAFQTDLPINQTIPIEIEQELPIQTNVAVPVDAGIFGTLDLNVPIDTTVPVSFEQDIVISETFSIDTAVPVYLEVPIEVSIADTPLASTLDDLSLRLDEMENSLSQPLIPLPGQ